MPHLPNFDRISALTATILLAYALARFVDLPGRQLNLQLPGVFLEIELNVNTAVSLLVAGLTASGADWLLRGHPLMKSRSTIQHWVLPGLTAWVLGITLHALPPDGLLWWVVFAIGASLLLMVLVAEYTVVDAADPRFAVASVGLTALSFALFLILAISLRANETRLLLLLPGLVVAAGAICLRTIALRLQQQGMLSAENGATAVLAAFAVAFVMGQMTTALHYWPVTPVAFGLALLGPAYALTAFLSSLTDGRKTSQALWEPGLILLVIWGLAIWFR